jgi:hypothetical protein
LEDRSYIWCFYYKNNGNNDKGGRKTFKGDGFVYGLGGGDGLMDIYLLPNSLYHIQKICTAFCISFIPQFFKKRKPFS